MTATVKVLLNQTRGSMFWKYHDGDHLDTALEFESLPPACGRVEMLLDIIWRELKVDDPQTEWAKKLCLWLRQRLDAPPDRA